MHLLDLIKELQTHYETYGNVKVMADSLKITEVEHVSALPGEHEQYIDIISS